MEKNNVQTTEERLSLTLTGLFDRAGYRRFRMSKFEEYGLYLENKNYLGSEKVITFNDTDGRLLALKPDVTLSIVKNAAGKLYYNENVYRLDKSTGKYREIGQTGLEAIGSVDDYTSFEVLSLAMKSLAEIDDNYILSIGNIGFIMGLLDSLDIPDGASIKDFTDCISDKNTDGLKSLCVQCGLDAAVTDALVQVTTASGNADEIIKVAYRLSVNDKTLCAVKELEALTGLLTRAGFGDKVRVDLSLLNNTDYYNDLVFQGYVSRAPRAVLTGGRYDGLAQKYIIGAQAIGFAVYLNEVAAFYDDPRKNDVDLLILYDKVCDMSELYKIAEKERAAGKSVLTAQSRPDGIRATATSRFADGRLTEVKNA